MEPGRSIALILALALAAESTAFADEIPGLPHSLAEAVKMERADALPRTAFYDPPSLAGTRPGDLLRKAPFRGYALPKGARAVRILYHSLNADGGDTATSGVVLIPAGRPPSGGWPVIAWAHGTSGVARMCAPSLEKDMAYGEEGLMPMVRAGFAVVATDYHGLGTPGPHEYINKSAQARDVIYSLPAAHAAVPSLGRRWVAVGHSQGGLAAWGVAEMEAAIRDPDYLGAISVAGAAEVKTILEQMGEPDSAAAFYLVYIAYAIHVRTPDFQPSDMLAGKALERYADITTKGCWNYAYASFLRDHGGKILKPGWDQTEGAQRFFKANELGAAPVGGPLLVLAGEADQTVPAALVKATATKACHNGVALAFRSYPGLDHDPTMEKSTPDQLAWARDRFAGKPFTGNCASLAPEIGNGAPFPDGMILRAAEVSLPPAGRGVMRPYLIALVLSAALAAVGRTAAAAEAAADLVVSDAKIYTEDAHHSIAEALAVRGGKIIFVGSAADAQRFAGPNTRREKLAGRLILPGLVDSHVHPLQIVDLDVCNLQSKAMTLKELTAFVAACLAHYQTPPGQLLSVHQWNYSDGNQPDADHPTLRAALDAASTKVRIELQGNDGHHGAYNSLALAQVKNPAGKTSGLSRQTLAKEFRDYRTFIGVDASGEPNGAVNEDARYLVSPDLESEDLALVAKAPEKVTQKLNGAGITAFLDAMVAPEALAVYDKLYAGGHMSARARLAQFYDPSHTRTADGRIDYDSILARAVATRAKYAHNPLIRADFIKIFADGVLEGNPYAVPPTLPDAASLRPFLQPIFSRDAHGNATVTGYVDTASSLCADVRAHPEKYDASANTQAFIHAHGYHPAQCAISHGELQHKREVILEYARRAHLAGFNLHIHAIGDTAVRTAIDAIEAARKADGVATTHDGLAHLQVVDPADVTRFGHDHLYAAFTYAWMNTQPGYDVTVIPFFQKVSGNSYEALHRAGSYYEDNAYPVKAIQAAGGILVAGSDAPVETSDPRPFVNMAHAVTRANPGLPALNPQQSIPLREVIDAYTVHGAGMLYLSDVAGSIETGKSADFIVLDRDILALADSGRAAEVADTKVLGTWFRGEKVYSREAPK